MSAEVFRQTDVGEHAFGEMGELSNFVKNDCHEYC